jgi:hypothetical protein
MSFTPSALRPNHALLALAVLLAGLAAWPLLPMRSPPRLRPAAVSPTPVLAKLPPATAFAAVAARPLFSPSRRPPAAVQGPVAASGLVERYRLIGVVDAGGEQRALLLDGTRRVRVEVGARLGGFAVSRIEHDRVVLTSPTGETVLPLRQSAK